MSYSWWPPKRRRQKKAEAELRAFLNSHRSQELAASITTLTKALTTALAQPTLAQIDERFSSAHQESREAWKAVHE